MTLYEKLEKTFDDKNVEAYLDLLHDDFVVVFHKSGNSFSKSEWGEMMTGMMANDSLFEIRLAVFMRMMTLWCNTCSCPTQMIQKKLLWALL